MYMCDEMSERETDEESKRERQRVLNKDWFGNGDPAYIFELW